MGLSVVLITKNEESRIRVCLNSLKEISDEIIIVDDGSNDNTREISKNEYKAVVIENYSNGNFDNQRNLGIDAAQHEWVLQMDADEVLPPETQKIIKEIISRPLSKTLSGYAFTKRDCVFKVPLRHIALQPGIKLFKKGKGRYVLNKIHEQLIVEGKTGVLDYYTLHYNYDSIGSTITRYNYYTDVEAKIYVHERSEIDLSYIKKQILNKSIRLFLKYFFIKKGYKDGIYGFVWTIINILHPILFWLKVLEYSYKEKKLNIR